MSPNRASCVICGAPVTKHTLPWMNEFRTVYIKYQKDLDWVHPQLSGVGVRGYEDDRLPTDPALRYNNPDIDQLFLKSIILFPFILSTEPSVYSDEPAFGFGFPFHDSCWGLLHALYHPGEVDLQLLHDFCRSCPVQEGRLNWGHDYEGLLTYKTKLKNLLPGEDSQLIEQFEFELTPEDQLKGDMYCADPLNVKELQRVIHKSLNPKKPADSQIVPQNINIISHSPDCFAVLPMEVRQEIMLHLPSKDVLNLKLASKIFAIEPLTNIFWASRFQRGFEFHYILEARKCLAKRCCFKTLYLGVKSLQSNGLRNRARIWDILLQLEELLFKLSSMSLNGSFSYSPFEPDAPADSMSWTFAYGNVKTFKQEMDKGCRALWTRTIAIPNKIIGVLVSFVEFNSAQYISGLRFQQHNGPDICLGYTVSKNECSVDMDGLFHHRKWCAISGFHLATGPRGIQAISLLTSRGEMSKWIGNAKGVPIMRLVAKHSSDKALKAGFDALKMVSLGISNNRSVDENKMIMAGALKTRRAQAQAKPFLRDAAQWFPDIPYKNVCLNETFFSEPPRSPLRYQPLTMVVYGGPQGIHLSKLIGITVSIRDSHKLYGIDFIYNVEVDGQKIHTLGCHAPVSDMDGLLTESSGRPARQEIHFLIDGPDGEIITGVDILQRRYRNYSEIYTNRDRIGTFPPGLEGHPEIQKDLPILFVQVPESTTITGFYAPLRAYGIIRQLGVISERI
ncbi:MAG: hypothetical protein M1834_008242 [Cirrosporium novae-zelandiae]|nr:MAG: hypothetical protein M1834_008242 [Cirrosporium novae-zelandiae]